MLEIEVNEYVRTKKGVIFKAEQTLKENCNIPKKYKHLDDPIVKHSKDIIDLIKVGDYVNGNEVVDKYLFNGEMPVLETTGNGTNDKCLCNGDIKTIVTKEILENAEYRIN